MTTTNNRVGTKRKLEWTESNWESVGEKMARWEREYGGGNENEEPGQVISYSRTHQTPVKAKTTTQKNPKAKTMGKKPKGRQGRSKFLNSDTFFVVTVLCATTSFQDH